MQTNYKMLGSVLSAILLLAIIATYFLYSTPVSDVNNSSNLINIAGRQRMLSQSIVKEFLIEKYVSSSKAGAKDSQVTLFKKSHEAILNGSQDLGLSPLPSFFVDDYERLDRYYQKFVSLFPEDSRNVTEKELIALADEQRIFIKEMNNFVVGLAKESTSTLKGLELKIIIGTIILILLLVTTYLIYINPAIKEIKYTKNSLDSTRSELENEVVAKLNTMIAQADTIDYHSLPQVEIDKIDNLRLEGKRALNFVKKNIENI